MPVLLSMAIKVVGTGLKDFLILGYYGFGNSGDDVLLQSVAEQLQKCKNDVKLEVLSKKPSETQKLYGLKSVKRDNPFSLLRAVLTCRVLLVGGGTLIQDSTSTKSLLYYLFVIRLAELFGKKVMLYANGIGKIKSENMRRTAKILNKVDVITLREEISKKELEKLGVTAPEIYLTADAAFGLDRSKIKTDKNYADFCEGTKYFCVSVRDHRTNTPDFVKTLATACDTAVEKYGIYPIFMPFQKSRDTDISMRIRNEMKNKSYFFDTQRNIYELLSVISGAEFMIGMRLHSLIYSAVCQTPSIALSYDVKVNGFMEYMGQKRCFDTEKVEYSALMKEIEECILRKEDIKKEIEETLIKMKDLAEQNAKIAIDLLEK